MCASEDQLSGPVVAAAVLTNLSLLQHVTSFQRGVLVPVAPLLKRYVDEGHVSCDIQWAWLRRWKSYRQIAYIATPLRQHIRPGTPWVDHGVAEAIAKYDTSFDVLRIALGACDSKGSNAMRLRRKLTHLVCEAATAFGRVDMLEWLYDKGAFEWSHASLIPVCIKVAVRHGQVESASWLEEHCEEVVVRDALLSFDMNKIAQRWNVGMLQWMATRRLGLVRKEAVSIAITTANIELLRLLLVRYRNTSTTNPGVLERLAVESGDLEIVQLVMTAVGYAYIRFALERAEATKHHHIFFHLVASGKMNPDSWRYLDWAMGWWARSSRLDLVAAVPLPDEKRSVTLWKWIKVDQCTEEVIKLLLPHTPQIGIIRSLLQHAAAKKPTVQLLYEHSKEWLPADIQGFIQRVMPQTLGPMASLIATVEASKVHELLPAVKEMYSSATRADVRDSILMMAMDQPHFSADILELDAMAQDVKNEHCDLEFVRLLEAVARSINTSWRLEGAARHRREELETRAAQQLRDDGEQSENSS